MNARSMKLLWSSRSPFVRKVMVAAHEVGVADRISAERVVVAADKPNANVMAMNPLNKIPTLLLEDGTLLYDSRVICEYLDSLHDGPKLHPSDQAFRWRVLRRQALGDGLLEIMILRLGEQCRSQETQSESHLSSYRLKAAAALDRISTSALLRTIGAPAAQSYRRGMPISPFAHQCGPPNTSMPIDRQPTQFKRTSP
jgi:glutathione S-transferase